MSNQFVNEYLNRFAPHSIEDEIRDNIRIIAELNEKLYQSIKNGDTAAQYQCIKDEIRQYKDMNVMLKEQVIRDYGIRNNTTTQ